MNDHIPIYIGVPSDASTTLEDCVLKAKALGLKVDRVDANVGAIHGSGPPGLVEQLRNSGLIASPVKKVSFGV